MAYEGLAARIARLEALAKTSQMPVYYLQDGSQCRMSSKHAMTAAIAAVMDDTVTPDGAVLLNAVGVSKCGAGRLFELAQMVLHRGPLSNSKTDY